MHNDNIDRAATIRNVKQFLKDYPSWHQADLRLQRLSQIRELTPVEQHQLAVATSECQLREMTMALMTEAGDLTDFWATLLTWRYLNCWSVTKVCQHAATRLGLEYLSERTYMRYQNRALLSFATLCPHNLFVPKKKD